jgi:dTDP-4-amino-4,6-dideoxygalactose transaminase
MQVPLPFVDLRPMHDEIRAELDTAISTVIDNSDFILGRAVLHFEEQFADYCGTEYSAGVSSGTAALFLVLKALQVGPGDEVIVPAHTFIATAMAVSQCGATPVFVDVDQNTWNITTAHIEAAITPKTKGVIAVHIYGLPADMPSLVTLCRRKGLFILEDAAQAHGASIYGKKVGSFGDAACFSFYPSKNLGALGEGGAVVSNNSKLIEQVNLLRDYGRTDKYAHTEVGYNLRLQGMQAAVLSVKLKHLDKWNTERRAIAEYYRAHLPRELVVQQVPEGFEHVYHLAVVRSKNRKALIEKLNGEGIGYGIHYPIPCHLQEAYDDLGHQPDSLPVSEALAAECLSLPLFVGMKIEQQMRVIDLLRQQG